MLWQKFLPERNKLLHEVCQRFAPKIYALHSLKDGVPIENWNNCGEGKSAIYDQARQGFIA